MDEAGWLALVAGEGGGGGGVALHQGDTRGEARLILSQGINFTSSGGHQRRPKQVAQYISTFTQCTVKI